MRSVESSALRLTAPAAIWILPVVFAAALFVRPWRREPILASPALLSTLPWWPVPLPPIALIWTGPLGWAPIAAAAAAAAIARLSGREAVHVTSLPRPRAHAAAAGLISLAAAVAAAWSVAPRIPGGDEPHYLVITQSLLSDGDLRIQNNHDRRDYAVYYDGSLAPDSIVRGQDGQQYSIHAPGVSALVLPGFAVFGYVGAQATIVLCAAAAGVLVWWIGWLAAGRVSAAWFAWAAVAGSIAFLVQSVTIYPDGPGALVTAAACWLLLRLWMRGTHERPSQLVIVGAALAALPWLHTRFAILAAGFGLAIVWAALTGPQPLSIRIRRLAAFLAVPVVSAAAWFLFFLRIYGTPDPRAPYGAMSDASWAFVPGGLAGLFFDQQFGLFTYAPVLVAVVALVAVRPPKALSAAVTVPLVIAMAYLIGVTTVWMWWAGRPATPARFANAVLPVLAAPLALVFARSSQAARAVWLTLLTLTLSISALVLGVGRGTLAWNDRTAQALWLEWLSPVVNLPRGWPSFFWRLDPALLSSEMPFFIHAGTWLVGTVLGGWLIARVARHVSRTAAGRAATVVWIGALIGMLLVQTGWLVNGVHGLDPARSQLSVLGRMANGDPLFAIGAVSVQRAAAVPETMRIRSEEAGRVDPTPPWLVLHGVPPGIYDLVLTSTRAEAGAALVHIGGHLFRTIPLEPVASQRVRVPLAAGARTLIVRPGPELRDVATEAEIVPVDVKPAPLGLARTAMRSAGSDVFFLDDHVYLEAEGFWSHGERTASFVFTTDPGRPAIALTLRNGPHPNVVTVQAGALTMPETLQPSETRTVTVPVDPEGMVWISLTTSRGFRPADVGGSRDRRYLGVWVEIR